jgi:deoxyribose-phosphate aldolase
MNSNTISRAELAAMLDHSVLKPEATAADIEAGCKAMIALGLTYYCVQPRWLALSRSLLAGKGMKLVTVVGFPHGLEHSATKAAAAALAVEQGAVEIDMVLPVGALKSGMADVVRQDIAQVVQAVPGYLVKVILETAALTEAEKRLACKLCIDAGAHFVKTSTGFHPAGGATAADIALMRECVGPSMGVKASGGIRDLAQAKAMIDAGASRIGTSASAAILAAIT